MTLLGLLLLGLLPLTVCVCVCVSGRCGIALLCPAGYAQCIHLYVSYVPHIKRDMPCMCAGWHSAAGTAAALLRALLAAGVPADQLAVQPSCPLQHVPYSLELEPGEDQGGMPR